MRVLVIAGSARSHLNCPAADSKALFFAKRVKEKFPSDWIIDILNLSQDYVLPKIQPCNACVSTSMALCVWPCNCYRRHSFFEADFMWDEDVYGRIVAADAILVCAPINWYGPTSVLKLLFDRLVCANGGNPREDLIHHKDANLAKQLEHSPEWKQLSLNHLEGRTAAFFVYGDAGGDELEVNGHPSLLRHPHYFDAQKESAFESMRLHYAPIIWQCCYSGIEVPEHLVKEMVFGHSGKYSDNQIWQLAKNHEVLQVFDAWVAAAHTFIKEKGKVPPSQYAVPLHKPDAELSPWIRQLQLLIRMVIGHLWLHTLGYFVARHTAKKYQLKESTAVQD